MIHRMNGDPTVGRPKHQYCVTVIPSRGEAGDLHCVPCLVVTCTTLPTLAPILRNEGLDVTDVEVGKTHHRMG